MASLSGDQSPLTHKSFKIDLDSGKRLLQFALLVLEFLLMGLSLWPACWVILKFSQNTLTAFQWSLVILLAILVFNYMYLLLLLLLRIIIPVPKEGYFKKNPDGSQPIEVLIFMVNILLVILRFRPPWAAFISSLLVNIFPLHYFYRRYFGPDTPSTTLGDTYFCFDPYLLKAGKNVQFGALSALICHHYDNKGFFIKSIEIGDNSVIGGHSIIMAGVKIGCNSIIGNASRVLPNTIIGDYEYWSGNPAIKIKDLRR